MGDEAPTYELLLILTIFRFHIALRRPSDWFPGTYLKYGLAPVVFSQMVRTLTGFHEAANSTERTSAIGFLIDEYSSHTRVKSTLSLET